MLVLGIETSCDETSAAVVKDGSEVLSCIIATSKKDFQSLSGVIPEDAARKQILSILPVIDKCLEAVGVNSRSLDALAVTRGPGLLGSLLVGTVTARALAKVWDKPLIGVHHTLGHLSSTWLREKTDLEKNEPAFPILTLSISGGHTDLWYRISHTDNQLLGSTRDDAAGEAFDKGASLLGLNYPGGPELEILAHKGDADCFPFPVPLKEDATLDFSFSGLKTSLKYLLKDLASINPDFINLKKSSIAAGFQRAICAHLANRIIAALDMHHGTKEVHIVGGVSANQVLKAAVEERLMNSGVILRTPSSLRFCTDNGAMIAAAGTFLMRAKPDEMNKVFKTFATGNL